MHLVRTDDGAVGRAGLECQIVDAAGGTFHPHGFRMAGKVQIGFMVGP